MNRLENVLGKPLEQKRSNDRPEHEIDHPERMLQRHFVAIESVELQAAKRDLIQHDGKDQKPRRVKLPGITPVSMGDRYKAPGQAATGTFQLEAVLPYADSR